MVANVNKDKWKITLDNEAVKAIRFCLGFNTDLRRSLNGVDKDSIWYWVQNNKIGSFGHSMLDLSPDPTDDDWYKYEAMLNDVVRQIIR